ncbi:non-homologous end-joining DNA ligase [Legionella nagasakiensis]|uniref:non-homologous end-joining DNA ligase n=1 Tax=Legionella nagasakiensis TaxID=535290 RepID=UPI001A9467CE|nr:non-homologous end-joining DNA ligase [Legionella nagasakiensis]
MMNKVLKDLPDKIKKKLIEKDQDDIISPMLAMLTKDYFSDKEWIYERKLDGERCLLHKKGKRVKLLSRNHKEQNDFYPEISQALKEFPGRFILDSELVTFDGKITSFARLQNRMHVKNPKDKLIKKYPVFAYVFDILYLDGYSLEELSLRKRKAILKKAFSFESSAIRYLPHRNERGEEYLQEACAKGWEGVIAKQAKSQYVRQRSKQWLKFKCSHGREFVIGGYTQPQGQRIGFGALLLGYYQDSQLNYCGRVGTGFDDEFLEFLHNRMISIQSDSCPFIDFSESSEGITWIKPELVAQVEFTEWTSNNKLRHPRFLGLRKDKDAKEVRKEET